MKIARFVLKIVALTLGAAAVVCCLIAYWDRIMDGIHALTSSVSTRDSYPPEYDDYADWDE